MSDAPDLNAMLARLLDVGREAGELVMRGYRNSDLRVSKKGAIDLVTQFDVASEQHIAGRLSKLYPEIGIVGEEGHARPSQDALMFFVDPIDGTTNFAHGHPFFCVSIGLCRNGTPLLGVLVAPALGLEWTAIVGQGAFRNGVACSVSDTPLLGDALCATGFGYNVAGPDDDNLREFALVQRSARAVRRCGAAALDLALVADGTYDAYWEFLLQPWDMAAGAAIVLAAGGTVTGFDGSPADVRTGACLASNGPLHEPLARVVAQARAGKPVPLRT